MNTAPSQTIKTFEDFVAHILDTYGTKSAVDSLSFLDMAIVLTRNGILLEANDKFTNLVGYSLEEIKGTDVTQLVVAKDRKELRYKLTNDFMQVYNLDLLTKSSEVRHVSVTPCVFESGGETYRLAGFIDNTDIIDLKNTQIHHLQNITKTLIKAIEVRDPYTIGHMSRCGRISLKLAKSLGLPPASLTNIEMGAGLHDVGKSAIPIEILTKPGKLEPHEWAFIKRHPETGHKILSGIQLDQMSLDIVLLHHECHDGSGYPYGLKGDDIPLEVAIVHTADCLEAIAGVRPYRKAYSFSEAIEIMEGVREKYHPEVLDICGQLVRSGAFSGEEYNPHPMAL